ncbi:unnamed protein product [Rhodiola kirilowii]
MVWFQCEDCGENLKKPKLAAHFWKCSAFKASSDVIIRLSLNDVAVMHRLRPDVWAGNCSGHTQCITEAEKYGPKGQVKPSNGMTTNTKNTSQKPEVDINVGLSDRPPWYCSLCKTNATSRQALLLHADGKKHRGKARAYHAANQKSNQVEVPVAQDNDSVKTSSEELVPCNTDVSQRKTQSQTEETTKREKKRKLEEADIISVEKKARDASVETCNVKKLITATLKTGPNEGLKMRKLKKLVIKALKESGATESDDQLNSTLEHKINSSHKFEIVGKYVRLATEK